MYKRVYQRVTMTTKYVDMQSGAVVLLIFFIAQCFSFHQFMDNVFTSITRNGECDVTIAIYLVQHLAHQAKMIQYTGYTFNGYTGHMRQSKHNL